MAKNKKFSILATDSPKHFRRPVPKVKSHHWLFELFSFFKNLSGLNSSTSGPQSLGSAQVVQYQSDSYCYQLTHNAKWDWDLKHFVKIVSTNCSIIRVLNFYLGRSKLFALFLKKSIHFGKRSLISPNFHSRPPNSIFYKSRNLQLEFDTYALSFYRSQNVLWRSKFFEPAQKFDCI